MAITVNGLIQLGFTPEVDFKLQDNSDGAGVFISEWNSASPQPSVAEIEAAEIEYQTTYDSQEYARNRLTEYPTIQECVHAILDDDLTALQVLRQAVKDKYPK